MLGQVGIPPFGFFEFGKFGLILFAAGLLYYGLFGYRLLPEDKGGEDKSFGSKLHERRTEKMPFAMGIFAFVVVMMASEFMELTTAAVLGACLVVATRCMSMKEAFQCIDWVTIFLFAGMLSMSAAMQKSGAAALVANTVVSTVSGPSMLMFVTCSLTMLLTNFMSNTATAALMAPLALPIAVGGGISPLPLMMGICMSASACFLTPIATPPNTIVLTPGRYTFLDYIKAGWPLQLISLALCVFVIPLIGLSSPLCGVRFPRRVAAFSRSFGDGLLKTKPATQAGFVLRKDGSGRPLPQEVRSFLMVSCRRGGSSESSSLGSAFIRAWRCSWKAWRRRRMRSSRRPLSHICTALTMFWKME